MVRNILYTTILVLLTPLFAQLTDTDKEISEQEQRDKRADSISSYRDTLYYKGYSRPINREIYIADKIQQRKEKRTKVRKWIIVGGVAIVSYYVGDTQNKYNKKRKFSKGKVGDKDYERY